MPGQDVWYLASSPREDSKANQALAARKLPLSTMDSSMQVGKPFLQVFSIFCPRHPIHFQLN